MNNPALKAAQGIDTKDLLDHIAWTDVIQPQIVQAKAILTNRLVAATLNAPKPGDETREQIAGRLYGIGFIEKVIEKILKEGDSGARELASQNLFIQ